MRDFNHFLFYSDQISENSIILDRTETNHAVKVLRLREKDHFNVTNGKGTVFTCALDNISANTAYGTIVNSESHKRHANRLHLNIGIPDRDALETALVDCTALGIERISPVICEYCQDWWWDKSWSKYSERLRNKMIAAMKQSLYPFLPIIDEPVKLELAVENISGLKIVADPHGKSLRSIPINNKDRPVACFIGPPGGYSEKEMSTFASNDCHLVNIAPTRLRTELASVVICAQIMCLQ